VNFAPGKIPSGGKSTRKCIYNVPAQETVKHPAKFGWRPVSDVAAVTKTRNPLKFARVPQTSEPISAVSEPKFAILYGHVMEILLFNTFFRLSILGLIAKKQLDKVVRWCADGDFCVIFASCDFSEPLAAHSKYALRSHHA